MERKFKYFLFLYQKSRVGEKVGTFFFQEKKQFGSFIKSQFANSIAATSVMLLFIGNVFAHSLLAARQAMAVPESGISRMYSPTNLSKS